MAPPPKQKPKAGKPPPKKQEGPTAIELIEEAYQRLRNTPSAAWFAYAIGTLPFILGFLCFWAAMSRSAYAYQWISAGALGLAFLYVWMKCWQSVFAAILRSQLTGEKAEPGWNWNNLGRLIRFQMFWHPTAGILLPLAAIITIPFPAVFHFYQNLVVLPFPRDELDPKELRRRAWTEASRWPGKTAQILGILFAIWFLVFLNLWSCFLIGPNLLKAFLGLETPFSRDPLLVLHSTILAACFLASLLVLDPLVKIIFLLKAHYGESQHNGLDLRVGLKPFLTAAGKWNRAGAALFLVGLVLFNPAALPAQSDSRAPEPVALQPEEVDQAVDKTLQRPQFSWRIPREAEVERRKIPFLDNFREWLEKFFQWQEDLEEETTVNPQEQSLGLRADWLFYLLIGLLAIVLIFWILRALRRSPEDPAQAAVALPGPEEIDLEDESLEADRFSQNEWIRLGFELQEKGQHRLALRAFFLGQLALLNERGHLRLGRYKSNRDYLGEIRLRETAHPGMLGLFSGNVTTFEAGWYGEHPVNETTVKGFFQNLEQLERVAAP